VFTETAEVKSITGKNVDSSLIERAQYAIEAYIGKFESEILDDKDLEICKRATAYQAAYMLNNEDVVFEQMSVSTTGINDSYTTFKNNDSASPFISPMAVMICHKLSFWKSRSIKVGSNVRSIPRSFRINSDWRFI
jgi:hypothetical protein